MQQKEKQEFVSIIRTETERVLMPLEDRLSSSIEKIVNRKFEIFTKGSDRKFGVFTENIDDKFKLVTERFDAIDKTLDKHTEMFKDIHDKLNAKADVKEVDSLERRVIKLEPKGIRPSRSG